MNEKKDLMGDITKDESSMKKYLLIGGGVFTIFVIGIVLSKFIFSSSSNDSTKVILPPEPTTINKKNDTNLFNSIPIEKESDNLSNSNNKDNTEEETIEKINSKATTEEIEKENKEVAKVPEKREEKKEEIKEIAKEKEIVKSQQKIEKVKEKVKKEVKSIQNKKVIRNYYLQVAAVTRGEVSKDFLKLINKNGFNYKIIEVMLNGRKIKRVLIGPFTKVEAKKALPIVKNKISSSAFIKRIK